MEQSKRSSFSGRLGYVLATAGSAVGLGNIWRFPYLAAKYGGGIFLLVYLILAVTFGYSLMMSETTIGRMSRKSPVGAFAKYSKGGFAKFGGWINALIPMIIMPYYCVIGGWVMKYLFEFIAGKSLETVKDGFFGGFITNLGSSESWFLIFSLLTMIVIIAGVEKGIERVSKILMPALVILAFIIMLFVCTRPGAGEGIRYVLMPSMKHFSIMTIVAALGQMFYSLSLAMGILYTYGSYMKRDVDIERSAYEVVLFDTVVAVLAALMIIPGVFAFSGGDKDVLSAGPSLLFVTLPKVLHSMAGGTVVGIAFFILVLFAALTSSVSLAEAVTSTFEDELHLPRARAAAVSTLLIVVFGTFCNLGYSIWSKFTILGMQILDFMDFTSNTVMMPISALMTCLLIVKYLGFDKIAEEVRISSKFRHESMYRAVIRFVAPVGLLFVFVSGLLNAFGIIHI